MNPTKLSLRQMPSTDLLEEHKIEEQKVFMSPETGPRCEHISGKKREKQWKYTHIYKSGASGVLDPV